jgi:hypothetical protein
MTADLVVEDGTAARLVVPHEVVLVRRAKELANVDSTYLESPRGSTGEALATGDVRST